MSAETIGINRPLVPSTRRLDAVVVLRSASLSSGVRLGMVNIVFFFCSFSVNSIQRLFVVVVLHANPTLSMSLLTQYYYSIFGLP